MEKDRKERLPDIGVARLEIKETVIVPLTEAVAEVVQNSARHAGRFARRPLIFRVDWNASFRYCSLGNSADPDHVEFNVEEGTNMRITVRRLSGIGAVLLLLTVPSVVLAQDARVRWDIVSLVFHTPPPNEVFEGGISDAKASDGTTLRFTGTGTFLARDGRRIGSGIATGGGDWLLISPTGVVLARGTYRATELVSWEFANLQTPNALNDHIGPNGANGNAVLLIEYSDGTQGVLFVLCHGPGAPDGISEGIAATKGFKTYDQVQAPAAGVNTNRTAFHILR